LTFSSNAWRSPSTAPVGGGTSFTMGINVAGLKYFSNTDCQIDFNTGTLPYGDVVVSALTVSPDQNPSEGTPLSNKYWIIHNYGPSSNFSQLSAIKFSNLGSFATGAAQNYKLYKRPSNAHGPTWGTAIDVADVLTTADNNTLTFSTNNSITSFSQFTIINQFAVAIELLDFKAALNDQKVDLLWRIADTKDVNHYIIERSTDGKSFDFLKKHDKTDLFSQDETPQYGVNYYRLKIVENDGEVTYSPIKSIDFRKSQMLDIKVYPNPTTDILNIQFNSETTQAVDFELFNVVGQLVHSYQLAGKMGSHQLFLRTGAFPKGLYSLRIKQGSLVVVEKVVID
jgi:hypothetical protein